MADIRIGKKVIGKDKPLYFIADIAANHDGDLHRAFKLIEMAKESGADAAKFQNFQADKIVSRKGFESLGKQLSHQAKWNKPVYEIYKDASIPFEWTVELKDKCGQVGIEYFSSPYDFESVDLIDPYVNVYKIGSGDITWPGILEYIARKGKPVIIATGSSTMEEVEKAMALLWYCNKNIVLMQCNTNYTGDRENFKFLNLNVLKTYAKSFPEAILGLSDHTPGHTAVLGAVALGARVFEKHFTDDTGRTGPDHKFSMDPCSWKEMVQSANELYSALGDGIKKIEDNERETAVVQRRSLFYARAFEKGHIITSEDIVPLRPRFDSGISADQIKEVIGKKLSREVQSDEFVKKEDFLNVKGK
ncbi:MAG: N-acetylneuraminate synthase family protein [Candidatus Omnitrophota bacterium]